MSLLSIKGLHVKTGEIGILKGVNLHINAGEVVALMGPNGSGKSTLANVLLGHPAYQATKGEVTYDGADLLALKPEERARAGLFLSFQYPPEVAGVTIGNFMRLAYNATHQPLGVADFLQRLKDKMKLLDMPSAMMARSVNEGFSGGEKKRAEMLQLAVLEPRLAILDETDSGLDIDSLKLVAKALTAIRALQPNLAILIITHYQRILTHLPPDRVAVMRAGKIVRQGSSKLLSSIEQHGFKKIV